MVVSVTKAGPLMLGLVLAALLNLCHGEGCFGKATPALCRLSVDESGDKCSWCASDVIPASCLPQSVAKYLPPFLFTCDDQQGDAADVEMTMPLPDKASSTPTEPLEQYQYQHGLPKRKSAVESDGEGDGPEDFCVTATSATECRSMVDKGGEQCSWCTSNVVPSTCLPPALAKYLPEFLFKCDATEEAQKAVGFEHKAEADAAAAVAGPGPEAGAGVQEYCVTAESAEECRSSVDDEGQTCAWCTCQAVPSECVPRSLAKKLPKAVFACDVDKDIDENEGGALEQEVSGRQRAAPANEEDGVDGETVEIFQSWKKKHGVTYMNEREERERLRLFQANLGQLASAPASRSYSLGLNRFSDMTWEEFQSTHLGFGSALGAGQNCSATHHGSQYRALGLSSGRAPPAARDWRDLGAVSGVKNQNHCGSCWTFSTTGCLESHHYLRTGEMVLLSEQQLLDCAGAYDNHGCKGGLPSHAFEYIASAGGLDTEEAYPYVAEESGSCSFSDQGVGAGVIRAVNITFQDERELLEAVGNTGPVSVAFQVAPDFKDYAGGVYDNPSCSTLPEQVNHAVLVVGYAKTEDGLPYWIIKNSWGTDWGIDGYFHMLLGKNMCGVADCASFPFVP